VRLLVVGGDGMLGHRLLAQLGPVHEVRVTLRRPLAAYDRHGLYSRANAEPGVDVRDFGAVLDVLDRFRPEAVVNAAGIVKQRPEARSAVPSIEVNALFPQRLAAACREAGSRMVHLSTDCVFSGRRGGYTEADEPDPQDLYGRTKLLGEVDDGACLVLRSSIIGLELGNRLGLVEWFLAQRGPVRGFRRAVYTGLTTAEMARVVDRVLARHPELAGLWHVAAEPVGKYDLLRSFAAHLGRDVEVRPDDAVRCDRSLTAERFRLATGWDPPTWDEMLGELAGQVREREGT
jgi:dTDP-4-dehydrorhamnose reductase